jgi:hypothetical protein
MTHSGTGQVRTPPSAIRTALWFAILTVPAAVAAYYRTFSGFAEWDDEGSLMMTVRQYLTGAKLYEEIYSGYGPVYYFFNWLVHSAMSHVLNHNAVRFTAVAISLLCALACAWIVLRLTGSLAVASVTHLLVFRALQFFTNEPGHPQELCMLLLVCLAGSGIVSANPRYVWMVLAAAGSLAAALTLVKVNLGIFAVVAVALAVLFQSPPTWFFRAAKYAACAAALLLPVALMRVHLNDPATQAYCVVITFSIAGVLAGAQGFSQTGTLSVRQCVAAAAGFAVTFVLILLVLVWQGVSMQATLNMLVLNHIRINVSPGFWYQPIRLGGIWTAWAVASVGSAILVCRILRSGQANAYRLLAPCQVLFGGAGLLIALAMPAFLVGFVTPFCWLLLCPRTQYVPALPAHARILLCTVTVLQTLYAFPIAGSQTYFLRVLLIVVAAVSLFDGLHSLPKALVSVTRGFSRPAAAVTLAAVALAYPVLAYRAQRFYASKTPLNLPGAERVHVEKQEAENFQWLVTNLRQNCDTFVGLPGIPSLYFWTGKPMPGLVHQPPGQLNFGQWMDMFTPAQQKAIIADLSRHPNVCAVYHPSGVDFFNTGKQDVHSWPLAHHILTQFKTIGESGDYQFMVPRERQLTIPQGVQPPPPRSSR